MQGGSYFQFTEEQLRRLMSVPQVEVQATSTSTATKQEEEEEEATTQEMVVVEAPTPTIIDVPVDQIEDIDEDMEREYFIEATKKRATATAAVHSWGCAREGNER